jgi:hypothetical protein
LKVCQRCHTLCFGAHSISLEHQVHFHCKEAEFLHWQEQLENKHAEVQWVYAYYKTMNGVWLKMAKNAEEGSLAGYTTYA